MATDDGVVRMRFVPGTHIPDALYGLVFSEQNVTGLIQSATTHTIIFAILPESGRSLGCRLPRTEKAQLVLDSGLHEM